MIPVERMARLAYEIKQCSDTPKIEALLQKKNSSDYDGVSLLAELANLFVSPLPVSGDDQTFAPAVYLMIDELDALRHAAPKEAIQINDMIRHLVDFVPNSFCVILAITAESTILSSYFVDEVLDRVTKKIEFLPMDRQEGIDFAKSIMDKYRIDDDKSRIGAFPFEDEALASIIAQLPYVKPRAIVNTMQLVLEELRLQGFDPASEKVSTDVLDDKEIFEVISGDA